MLVYIEWATAVLLADGHGEDDKVRYQAEAFDGDGQIRFEGENRELRIQPGRREGHLAEMGPDVDPDAARPFIGGQSFARVAQQASGAAARVWNERRPKFLEMPTPSSQGHELFT